MEARRYNNGKLRYELISSIGLEKLAEVYTKGAAKYTLKDEKGKIISDGSNNWKSGLSWMSMIASVQRHIEAWKTGEENDSDLGTKHLANAAWGLIGLLEYEKTHPELDDRQHWYKKPFKRVYLDLDGVCVAFDEYFIEYFNLPTHETIDWADYRFIDNLHKVDENFWLNCPPLFDPKDLSYPITGYCTARNNCSTEIIHKWLEKNNFPKGEILNVGFGGSKIIALKEKCDVFLDDSIRNFVDLNSNGILCYLTTRSHNFKYEVGHMRVDNILEFIKKIKS